MSRAVRLLLIAWATLLTLLALAMTATFLRLGLVAPFVSYGIALTKAGLIFWLFMDVRKERGIERLAGLSAFSWVAIMLLFLAADYLTRGKFVN